MNTKHYLLIVCGQVEPNLTGPMDTEEKVLNMAREHWAVDKGHEDGMFSLYIDEDGKLHAEAFLNTDFEE